MRKDNTDLFFKFAIALGFVTIALHVIYYILRLIY